jgi:hypothetical protein
MAEFNFPTLGSGYGSDQYGTRDITSKLLHNVHDLSVTVGPDELNKLLHDSTTGALLTEQEPWRNGE